MNDELKLIDLGDATIETRQREPGFYPDSELFPEGSKWP